LRPSQSQRILQIEPFLSSLLLILSSVTERPVMRGF